MMASWSGRRLTGDVQVSDGTSVLWADRVVMEQETGDAAADGSVKASYLQPKDSDAKNASRGAGACAGGAGGVEA